MNEIHFQIGITLDGDADAVCPGTVEAGEVQLCTLSGHEPAAWECDA
jgi:hypothetical protein